MGNDGGSIPKRRELVKEAARIATNAELKETQQEQQEYHWSTCPLSHEPLSSPIVSDSSGKLYNKDAILGFLLPSDDPETAATRSDTEIVLGGRVKSLRDVVEVKFHVEEKTAADKDGRGSSKGKNWVCPISNKALGPGIKAVYLVPCGHAFLENAIREVSSDVCLQCNEAFAKEDIINILPTSPLDQERLAARAQILKNRGLTHSLKKASGSGKKRKKADATDAAGTSATATRADKAEGLITTPQPRSGTVTPLPGIKNAATASLTAKVLAEEQVKAKRRKLETNGHLKSLFSSGQTKHKDGDFMTRGFSIPANARH